jgi:hypothetical protein
MKNDSKTTQVLGFLHLTLKSCQNLEICLTKAANIIIQHKCFNTIINSLRVSFESVKIETDRSNILVSTKNE